MVSVMKQFNWIKALLLNVVTCGIYSIYMWYKMNDNNNKLAEKEGLKTNMNFIVAMLLSVVTCGIFLYVWYYKFFKTQVALAKAHGVKVAPTENAIVLLILVFVPIYSFYMMCDNYNRTVAAAE